MISDLQLPIGDWPGDKLAIFCLKLQVECVLESEIGNHQSAIETGAR